MFASWLSRGRLLRDVGGGRGRRRDPTAYHRTTDRSSSDGRDVGAEGNSTISAIDRRRPGQRRGLFRRSIGRNHAAGQHSIGVHTRLAATVWSQREYHGLRTTGFGGRIAREHWSQEEPRARLFPSREGNRAIPPADASFGAKMGQGARVGASARDRGAQRGASTRSHLGRLAQMARAARLQRAGRGFESLSAHCATS